MNDYFVIVYLLPKESHTLCDAKRTHYMDFSVAADSFTQAEENAGIAWRKLHGNNYRCITRLWHDIIKLYVTEL